MRRNSPHDYYAANRLWPSSTNPHTILSAADRLWPSLTNQSPVTTAQEFVQKLLPEDFPARGGMGRFGGGGESYLLSQLETARAMEARRHAAVAQWQQRMSVDDLERLMREKLEGRVRGGPSHLRKAFRYVDQDGDGKLSPEELQLVRGSGRFGEFRGFEAVSKEVGFGRRFWVPEPLKVLSN